MRTWPSPSSRAATWSPSTPQSPPLTIIPGDRQVTLTWSDVNLQTPDPYYGFLQQNPELDPNGVYREYDFEGYRLYRSFVGPNDSHSEKIWQSSLGTGDLHFFYVDRYEDDHPYYRMRNGMKVWYAIVPYDRNYDPSTGGELSLPAESSGKTWNRPGESGLYNVIPRSDASNFKPAEFGGFTFQTGSGATLAEGTTAQLTGDGTGKLTEAPKALAAVADFTLEAVTAERILTDQNLVLVCTSMESFNFGGCNYPTGTRKLELRDAAGAVISEALISGVHEDGGANQKEIVIHGPVTGDGAAYALMANFSGIAPGSLYYDINPGTYTGATVGAALYRCGATITSAPNNIGWTRSSQYTLTWGATGNGELTLQVHDNTLNVDVPFGQYPDDFGWGIAPGSIIGDRWGSADNIYNELSLPKAERTSKMLQSLPANNTEGFGIWLNGIFWVFGDLTAMPAPGTTMTVTTAWGAWNGDNTVFTQAADVPYAGDKWNIQLKATTINAEDADLSKIKVVPNPYMASSFLDLSPNQRRIEFVNLPDRCTIRVYTLGGNLVNVLNHIGANRSGWGDYTDWDRLTKGEPKELTGFDNHGGTEAWNLRNRFGQTVASGLYFFHVTDSRGETQTGKFYIIN